MLERLLVGGTSVTLAGPVELASQAVGQHYSKHVADIVVRVRASNSDQAMNLKNENEIRALYGTTNSEQPIINYTSKYGAGHTRIICTKSSSTNLHITTSINKALQCSIFFLHNIISPDR